MDNLEKQCTECASKVFHLYSICATTCVKYPCPYFRHWEEYKEKVLEVDE